MQERGVFLAIAIVDHNHNLENIMLLERITGDSFSLFDDSTCKVPALGFVKPFGKIREKSTCSTIDLQSPGSREQRISLRSWPRPFVDDPQAQRRESQLNVLAFILVEAGKPPIA